MSRKKTHSSSFGRESARLEAVDDALHRLFGDPDAVPLQNPLDTLVLTILSQNTNDINRDKAWLSMKARFGTWEEVEAAPTEELELAIRVGGLAVQKAARIQNALRTVRARTGGFDLTWLRKTSAREATDFFSGLPGVGPKTLSIVLLFSLGFEAFPLDTHCLRILGRVRVLPASIDPVKAHSIASALVNPGRSMPLHLNLIRFGREVCHARGPKCRGCPLRRMCSYEPKN